MKKYTTYKPSGIEWIGDIPEHWNVSKYKYNLSILSGFPFKSELFDNEVGYPLMRIRDITSGTIETYYTGDFNPLYIVKKGDVIIGMDGEFNTRIWDNIDILLNQRCCKITDYKNILLKFIYYTLPIDLKIINDLTYYTTVKHLSVDDIKNISCIIPPIHEQHQIVQFLDEKTEIIDKLISTKERKIELLKEQRTSLINQVITKGLDPKVKMKDSGVVWIGEIPEHWEVSKLKYKFSFKGGGTPSKEKDEYWDGDIPWVSPKDMKSLEISSSQDTITKLGLENSSTTLVEENSLLIVVRSGILQRTIPVGINTIPVSINQDLKSLTSKNGFPVKFLYYFIKGNEINLLKDWSKEGTTVESIEMEFMSNSILPLPPQNEQHQIVEYLDKRTKEIDDLMSLEQKKIEVLKEYRQSLISEVITGKIKVYND